METKTDGITNIEMPIYYGTDDGGELEEYMLELLNRITEEYNQMIEMSDVSEEQKIELQHGGNLFFPEDVPKIREMSGAIKLKYATLCTEIGEEHEVEIGSGRWWHKVTICGETIWASSSYPDLRLLITEWPEEATSGTVLDPESASTLISHWDGAGLAVNTDAPQSYVLSARYELLKRIYEEYDYEQMMTEAGVSEQMKDAFWRRDTSGVSTYEDAKKALELANSIKAKTRQLYADIEDKYTVRIYRNGTLMEGYQNGKLETVNLDCDASDPYHIPTDVPMEDNVIVPLWATGGV